jgi:uncharacterized membrane protein YheB (UPF0754 family)
MVSKVTQAREVSTALIDPAAGVEIEQGVRELGWNGEPIELNSYGLPIIWTYEPPEMRERPRVVQWARVRCFKIFLVLAFGGTFVILFTLFLTSTPDTGYTFLGLKCSKAWLNTFKYLSIPLVSIVFTWWHVWLGIKMCFYPVHFVGCLPPVCGWQGIVPRRAHIMASRSCDIMIGKLLMIEEIIDRIEPQSFFEELQPVLLHTTTAVLDKLARKRCPGIWETLPDHVKDELHAKILETGPQMFTPVLDDVKRNIHRIVDVKQMAIQILVENKPLLVEMFQKIGAREFTFIQHFSAVLGFILGSCQMLLWIAINSGEDTATMCKKPEHKHDFKCWAGFVVLPVSGLVIGYLTNWLGINLIFRPVWPHIMCGGFVNVQGVFLKRQKEVSLEMTKMICEHLVTARKMLEFVVRQERILETVLEIFKGHVEASIGKSTAAVEPLVNVVAGRQVMVDIKDDIVKEMLEELPNHSRKIEEYMDSRFDLLSTMSYRLSHLPPADFEGMLHPVFQEDEWMVLLLGGVLGVAVGTMQAFLLGS